MSYKVMTYLRRIQTMAAIACAVCIVSVTTSRAQSYTFTAIDVPGASSTFAEGINNQGQIVGAYSYPPADQDGHQARNVFVLTNGSFSTFGYPGAYYSIGYGINNAGQIVGICQAEYYGTFGPCQDFYGIAEGWVKTGGSYATVSFPGAISYATNATGINDSGQVVGQYELPSGSAYGYLLSGGSYTTVNPFGGVGSTANGINNAGDIVGFYCQGNCTQVGFLQSGGNVTTITYPGASSTVAVGINNSDEVVGYYLSAAGLYQGFLWQAGTFVLLSDPLGVKGTIATGINDAGQIVGYYVDVSDVLHGFVASPGAPAVSLSSASLTFGPQEVGSTSASQTVTLTNTGTAALSPLTIVPSGDFSQFNTCGNSVAAGANCPISVTFTPTTFGTRTGAITITDNAANSPQTIKLSGLGLLPAVLSPSALTFGNQAENTTSAAQTLTLTNTQPAALAVSISTSSGDFAQTNTCGGSVPARGKCTISVTFTPSILGLETGTLSVTDLASNSPQTAMLAGRGVAQAAVAPSALRFAAQTVGSTSAASTLMLTNNLSTTLPFSITFTGANPGDFAGTNACGGIVAAKSTCTISVTFTPAATGTRTAILNLNDSANNSPQIVTLNGTGQ